MVTSGDQMRYQGSATRDHLRFPRHTVTGAAHG